MPRLPLVVFAAVSAGLLAGSPVAAQGPRPAADRALAAPAGRDTGTTAPAAPRALPPSALTGRTPILSEIAVGEHAGPFYVTLAEGGVYRLQLLQAGGTRSTLGENTVSNAHWLLDDEVTPDLGVTVTPLAKNWPPLQLLRPLDAGYRSVGGLDLLLRPRRSGEYRIDATSTEGATLLIRVVRQDADEVEFACLRERQEGEPRAACGEMHLARRSLNPLGILTRPLAVLLFVAVGALLGS